jgi:hypothetical protein
LATAALMPSWASEITSFTPRRPRRARLRSDIRQRSKERTYLVTSLTSANGTSNVTEIERALAAFARVPKPAAFREDHLSANATRRSD